MSLIRAFGLVLFLATVGMAQFIAYGTVGMIGTDNGTIALADFDNDGDLDILVIGIVGGMTGMPSTELYRNDGGMPPVLTPINHAGSWITIPIPGLDMAAAAWGDFDGDGWLDLAVSGATAPNVALTAIYRNLPHPTISNARTLVDLNAGLTPLTAQTFSQSTPGDTDGRTALAWFDMDNDGDLDLAAAGHTGAPDSGVATTTEYSTTVYRNIGTGFVVAALLTGVRFPAITTADFDGDGFTDILVIGDDGTSTGLNYPIGSTVYYKPNTTLYRNLGGSGFQASTPFLGAYDGDAEWADFDGDGDPDLIVSGYNVVGQSAVGANRVYRNDGVAGFVDVTSLVWPSGSAGGLHSSIAVGDINCDLLPDFILQGQGADSDIYLNQGGFLFTRRNAAATFGFVALRAGDIELGDIDGDGYLDFANVGQFQVGLYGNTTGAMPTTPFPVGTGDDFAIALQLNGAPVTPLQNTASTNDLLSIALVSPGGACYATTGVGAPILVLAAQIMPCGVLPQSSDPYLYLNFGATMILGPGGLVGFTPTLTSPGLTLSFGVPAGMPTGLRIIFQGVLVFPSPSCTSSGGVLYASTDAPILQF